VKGWIAPRFANEHRTPEFDREIACYLRTLIPRAEFIEAVNRFALPPLTVGVHIRRGDPTREFIDEYRRSEDAHFIAIMQAVLDAVPGTQFFLATDHPPTEVRLRELFGHRILTYRKTSLLRHRQAIREAMMDLLLLSRTAAVIGTHFSTFSEGAAMLGSGLPIFATAETATKQLAATTDSIVAALETRTSPAETVAN
jgi:hypothetical protein